MASLDDLMKSAGENPAELAKVLEMIKSEFKEVVNLPVRQQATLQKKLQEQFNRYSQKIQSLSDAYEKGALALEQFEKQIASNTNDLISGAWTTTAAAVPPPRQARANQPHANPPPTYRGNPILNESQRGPRSWVDQPYRSNDAPSGTWVEGGYDNRPAATVGIPVRMRERAPWERANHQIDRERVLRMANPSQGNFSNRMLGDLENAFPTVGGAVNRIAGADWGAMGRRFMGMDTPNGQGSFMSNMFFHGGGIRGFATAGLGNVLGSQTQASGISQGFDAAIALVNKFADNLNSMNDGSKTAAQKFDDLGKLVGGPVYSAFMNIRDAAMGVQEGLRRNRVHHERQAIVAETSNRIADTRGQMERDGVMPRARAANPLQLPVWEGAQFDRTRADQDNDYREYSMRYEARSQFARSGQNLAAANSAVAEQEARVRRQQQAVAASEAWASSGFGRMNRTRGAETNPLNRNRVGVDDAGRESEYRQNETLRERRRLEQEILALNAARTNQIQAQAQHETNRINLLRTEVEILRNREQAMGQASRRLGAMSNSEISTSRSQREYVRRHLAEGGDIGDLPSDLVAGAGRISPREIGRYQEERGERIGREEMQGDTRNREDAWMFEGGETRRQLQIRLEQMTAQVNVAVQLNENTLAQRIAQEVGPAIARLVNVIRSQVGNRLNSYESGQVVRNNNQ